MTYKRRLDQIERESGAPCVGGCVKCALVRISTAAMGVEWQAATGRRWGYSKRGSRTGDRMNGYQRRLAKQIEPTKTCFAWRNANETKELAIARAAAGYELTPAEFLATSKAIVIGWARAPTE